MAFEGRSLKAVGVLFRLLQAPVLLRSCAKREQ